MPFITKVFVCRKGILMFHALWIGKESTALFLPSSSGIPYYNCVLSLITVAYTVKNWIFTNLMFVKYKSY